MICYPATNHQTGASFKLSNFKTFFPPKDKNYHKKNSKKKKYTQLTDKVNSLVKLH